MITETKKLTRSQSNRMVGGVCAGLGEYFDIDATVVRLLFVLGFFLGVSTTLWVYLVMWIIVPEK
ncbi:MAG: PspC domain-containing protein [Anaerolineales bacterium]|nr:PspC domain-containing protein [Anaerolineales bacterium]